MFTQCSNCQKIFSIQAGHLRAAMGMLRCTGCGTVFNALARLRDDSEVFDRTITFVGAQVSYSSAEEAAAGIAAGEPDLTATLPGARSPLAGAAPGRSSGEAAAAVSASPAPAVPDDRRPTLDAAPLPTNLAGDPEPADAGPSPGPGWAPTPGSGAASTATGRVDTPPPAGDSVWTGPDSSRASEAAPPLEPSFLSRLLPSDILLALRNLMRHKQRTALALGAISFGVIALMLAGGFVEWVFWAMRESAIQGRLGHIEVTRPGFLEEGAADPFAYLLPAEAPEETVLAGAPGVKVLAPRLTLSGLASHGDNSVSFLADAVDPAKEKDISVDFRIAEGEELAAGDTDGAIFGLGLAALLGVKPGDRVTLLANTSAGGLNGVEVTVKGLFYTSNKVWNDTALRLHIDRARELVRVEGSHLWVLLLDDTALTDPVLTSLRNAFGDRLDRFQFTPWYTLADFYTKTVALFSQQMNAVRAIIGLIIVLGISNVLVMGVMQRTAEIGTLMAVGLKRRKVLQLFLSEGLVLGLLGAGGGALVGFALGALISWVGIPMPPAPGMDEGFTAEIRITPELGLTTFLLAFSTTVLASVYPAWKASRLEIVNALRHSR
jgi:putative ABC transport system permease protein